MRGSAAMPENTILQKGTRASTASGGTAGTELGDQGHPEPKSAGQPVGRFKMICRQIAVLALDILELME